MCVKVLPPINYVSILNRTDSWHVNGRLHFADCNVIIYAVAAAVAHPLTCVNAAMQLSIYLSSVAYFAFQQRCFEHHKYNCSHEYAGACRKKEK